MTDVQQLAETTLGKFERMSVKAELKRADEVIQSGERVEMLAVGSYRGSGNSLIIATDRRLIALNETGMFGKKLQVHDITYSHISHVASEAGVTNGKIMIAASGGDIDIERILPTGRSAEIANYIRTRLGTTVTPASTTAPDITDQLRKLGELHAAGVLTDEEFSAKKAELLARL